MSDQHLVGTEGDDFLEGADGNDWLEGLAGNDTLIGNGGHDFLDGGAGQDTLVGGAGDEYYNVDDPADMVIENFGEGIDTVQSTASSYQLPDNVENLTIVASGGSGTGNDAANTIYGNDGDNFIAGRGGDDVLVGFAGNDYIVDDGDGNDLLDGGAGSDFLIGVGGNDLYLPGLGGQDTVYDSAGDDEVRLQGVSPDQIERIREEGSQHLILRVAGTTEQVTLYNWFVDASFQIERVVFDDATVWTAAELADLRYLGTAGNDFLGGTEWSERLEGFGGSDELFGAQGDDVYVLQAGGADKVYESFGDDEVRWQGVSADQVERIRPATWSGGNTYDLVLRIAGSTDTLTLTNYFYSPEYQVERVVFDDATVWTAAQLADLRYLGTAGNDFLGGTEWSERLEGFGGSDELFGAQGDDVYVLQAGGADKVYESFGDDEVRWQGVSADQVERIRPATWSGGNTYDLVLRIAGSTDTLTLTNYFYSPEYQVERVVFDDATVWTAAQLADLRYLGTAGNDFLGGTEWSERLEGFGGSDELFGAQGDDVYVLQAGGADKVYESFGDDEVRWQGVSADQVERIRPATWSGGNTYDLVLRIAGSTDTLTLTNYFYSPEYQVERVVFDDATVWTAAQLADLRYLGTAGNDFLGGTEWSERLEGFGGSDELFGAQGDDVYVLQAGGADKVYESFGDDEVRWQGVSADQVERIRPATWSGGNTYDLVLRIAGSTDTLTLTNYFYSPEYQVERVVFDDATVWTAAQLADLRYLGTAGNDFLGGTEWSERLEGFGGSDELFGAQGDDVYVLQAGGADKVYESFGDDEVRWQGVSADQVERIRQEGSFNLELRVAGSTDTLTLTNYFYSPEYQVERVVFDDGTVWGVDELWPPVDPGPGEITGTAGDDLLAGIAGFDYTMYGLAGNDTYVVDSAGDVVVEMPDEGIDTVRTSVNHYILPSNVENLEILGDTFGVTGNELANTLIGNAGVNSLNGAAGADLMIGGGGDDHYFVDDALDVVQEEAGAGVDVIYSDISYALPAEVEMMFLQGEFSTINATGNSAANVLFGTMAANVLDGGAGADELYGQGGNDIYIVDDVGDIVTEISADWGIDTVHSSVTFALGANLENLVLTGTAAINGTGNELNNTITGNAGANALDGGAGADTYVFDAWDGAGNSALIAAGDRVYLPGLSRSSVLMTRDASNLYITVMDTGASIVLQSASGLPGEEGWRTTIEFGDGSVWSTENIINTSPYIGTNGNDVLNGSEFGDQIFGVGGDDVIHGNDGNDVLYGGAGQDTLYGGAGNDYYYVADGADVLVENAGEGDDSVESSVSFSLAANLENLYLTGSAVNGSGNDLFNSVIGNAADNILAGNDGNDLLNGREGDDVLDGGLGQDTMHGGAGNDRFVVDDVEDRVFEDDGAGVDTVESSVNHTLGAAFENLTLTGTASIGNGNASQNILVGNAAGNTLYGYGGDDALSGMGGSDLLNGGAGNDVLLGGDGSDSLYGDLGDDVLDGGAGNDEMLGWAGNDTYHFARGSGSDVAWELLGTAADTDIVLLGADIAPSDISVHYLSPAEDFFNIGGFLLQVTGTADVLKIVWSPTTGADLEIEEVRFANGTVWTESTLVAKAIENGEAPVLAAALADQAASEDSPFAYTLPGDAFTDADIAIGDSLAYSAVLADGSALPTWLAFDAITRTFSGTPANGDVGSISMRVTATDESGRSASDILDLGVANTNDAPTVAAPLADQAATEDSAFSFTPPAGAFADVDAGDTLSYSAAPANGDPMPSWLAFDAVTRTFSGTPSNGDVGTFSIRVTAADGAGAIASDVFDIVVANTNDAPTVANAIADQSAQDTVAFNFTLPADTFADVDAGDVLTYAAGPLPSWLSFDAGTRTFSGTPGAAHIGVTSVEMRATDSAGVVASDVFNITVAQAPDQTITGTSGNDTLTGGSGNDTLNGLGGADSMSGGLGNDTYFVDNNGDQVNESAGAGTDTVHSSISYTLGQNLENLTLTGSGNRSGTGNALDNVLTGNSGNNTLSGGAGNDTYYTGSGDSVNESAGAGDDTAYSSVNRTLWANVEALVLTGTSNLTGTGNSGANLIRGNTGGNTLQGSGGIDILEGGGGNDALNDTSGNGLLNAGAGSDSLTGGSARELYIGGAGDDTLTTGTGADIIAFNAGDGQDTVSASTAIDNWLSLGGGIAYEDLRLSRSGNNLVLATSATERITFSNWYSGAATVNPSILNLQVIAEAMADFDAGSSDPLLNRKVQRFDFQGLVGEFEDSGLSSWALADALLEFHLGGSDSEALGGDLAYRYGRDATLAGIGFAPAQQVLGASQFGTQAQALSDDTTLQQGAIRLG